MTVFERIKFLAKRNSKTMKQVTLDLGYSENYFYSMKTGKQPSAEKLKELADYFNVSTDYLLGRTDNPNTQEKQYTETDLSKMLDNAMSFDGEPMSDQDREVIMAYLRGKYGK